MARHVARRALVIFVGAILIGGAASVWLIANWAGPPGKLSDPSWAGKYKAPNPYGGHFLSVTQAGRFIDEEDSCTLHDVIRGTVDDSGGRLGLKPRVSSRMRPMYLEYLMIHWGKRRYLIPPEEILDFCAAVRGGCEPRDSEWGDFLLYQGDEKVEPDAEEPQLPDGFQRYLRMHQLDVRIKTIAKKTEISARMRPEGVELEYAVTLDAGSAEGVLPRMRFCEPSRIAGGVIVIEETSPHESKGVLDFWRAGGPSFTEPKAGDRFRTPWMTPCLSPKVFPFAGKVIVDGAPSPQGDWQIVVMLDDQTELSRITGRPYAVCRADGSFAFTTYRTNDGARLGTYVVLIAGLQRDKGQQLVGPDSLHNLYNDPAVNANRTRFVIEHNKPGRTDYVFDLKIRGVEPNKRPGSRALTEITH